jgi:hypothetical protein
VRQAPALHSDETSWWVAGPGWWLWVFTTQLLTFYVVAQSRGRDLLNDVLGTDFRGVLVSDCLAIYDDATELQQKCYAHLPFAAPAWGRRRAKGQRRKERAHSTFLASPTTEGRLVKEGTRSNARQPASG